MSEEMHAGDNFTSEHNSLGKSRKEFPRQAMLSESEYVGAVIEAVAQASNLTPAAITGRSQMRSNGLCAARHCAAYLLQTMPYGRRYRHKLDRYRQKNDRLDTVFAGLSLPAIGRHLNRDHSTVRKSAEQFGYRINASGFFEEKHIFDKAIEPLMDRGLY